MEPNDAFFHAQEAELANFEDERVLRFIRLLEQARQHLNSELRAYDTAEGYNRIQALIDQIDQIHLDLKTHFKDIPNPLESLAKMVARHQTVAITEIVGTPITIAADTIPTGILAQLVETNFEHVTSIASAQFDQLRTVVFNRIGIQGQNPRKVAADVTGPEGTFTQPFHIVENVLRTESSTLYNEMRLDSLTEANQAMDLGLNKRIIEKLDIKRNHPISRVTNDKVQESTKPFKVKVSEVVTASQELEYPNGKPRKISQASLDKSIFWAKEGAYYVGQNLPAHYRERGIVVPTAKAVTVV